jgi:hypothetical protein
VKYIYFLTISLFISSLTKGQQITISYSVNVTLPTGSSSITAANALNLVTQKFPSYPYLNDLVGSSAYFSYYNIGGNLLQLYYKPEDGRGSYLATQKQRSDAIGAEDGINTSIQYTSSISNTPGGVAILLTYTTASGLSIYHFIANNPNGTGVLIGKLSFAVGDITAVTTILTTILNSIAFITPSVPFVVSNTTANYLRLIFQNGPNGNVTITLNPHTSNLSTVIPIYNNYQLVVSPNGQPGTCTFKLGVRSPVSGVSTTFNNVNISPGSYDLSMTIN